MATINTGPLQIIVSTLLGSAQVLALVAVDSKGKPQIKIAELAQQNDIFPMITIWYKEEKSQIAIPSSSGEFDITYWVDDIQKQPQQFMNTAKEIIMPLFNRKGYTLNQIDVPTNTGVAINLIMKQAVNIAFDEIIKKYYCEMKFTIVNSEGESFDPAVAGNVPWL